MEESILPESKSERTWDYEVLAGGTSDRDTYENEWNAFDSHYRPILRQGLVGRLPDPDDIEDVLSITFSNARRAMHRYQADAPVGNWLFRIATRVAHNLRVAEQKRRDRDQRAFREMETASTEDPLDALWDRTLMKEMGALAEDDKRYIKLLVMGFSHAELASKCGLKNAAVSRQKLKKLREKLRALAEARKNSEDDPDGGGLS